MDSIAERQRNRIYILMILLAGFVTYYHVLTAGFLALDDPGLLNFVKMPDISIKNLFLPIAVDRYYRPLAAVTFLANFSIFGDNPAAFHFVNVLIHLSNSLLVYYLVPKVMNKCENCKEVAFVSSLIFALHPINTEAVLWISARTDLLSCFFFLLSLILIIENCLTVRFTTVCCIFLSYLCSIMSKESAIMLLPLSFLFFYIESKRLPTKNIIILSTTIIVATICYLFLRNGFNSFADNGLGKVITRDKSLLEILISDFAAYGFYLRKMIYPFPLQFAITKISTVANLIMCGFALVILSCLYYRQKLLRLPALIVLTGLIPPILALNGNLPWTPYAERYTYLPFTGTAIIMGFVLCYFLKKAPFVLLVVGVLFLSIPTYNRVKLWSEPISFWQGEVAKSSEFSTLRLLFAVELLRAGKFAESEQQLKKAYHLGFSRKDDLESYNQLSAYVRGKIRKTELRQ